MSRGNKNWHQDEIVKLSSDIAPGLKIIISIGQRVKKSILDYALGAAILGLVPIYGNGISALRLFLLAALNLKMMVNIGRFWGYHRGQGSFEFIDCILAIVGSFILSIFAWLGVFAVGLFLPLVDSLARAIAYGVLTWNVGRAVSRYFYSPKTLDTDALVKAIRFQQSNK